MRGPRRQRGGGTKAHRRPRKAVIVRAALATRVLPADVRESLLQEAALDLSPRGTILYLEGDPAERVY